MEKLKDVEDLAICSNIYKLICKRDQIPIQVEKLNEVEDVAICSDIYIYIYVYVCSPVWIPSHLL